MFKKIKDWIIRLKEKIIKKLGGYTKEEFTAMANIGNATAEAAQKLSQPVEMARGIKEYCRSVDRCAKCIFPRELGAECPLTEKLPYCWDLKRDDR